MSCRSLHVVHMGILSRQPFMSFGRVAHVLSPLPPLLNRFDMPSNPLLHIFFKDFIYSG